MNVKPRALVIGVANERSLAWSIVKHLKASGFEIAMTYQNEALEKRVRPLASELSIGSDLVLPLDVNNESQVESVFETLKSKWGYITTLVHAVAFANREDLEGRFIDTNRLGFRTALESSAYSLVECSRAAENLLKVHGGSILTLSYIGSQKVVPHYNVMGVAKAALEASVRYLAYDLGKHKIRVNAISAGPVKTLAAAGIRDFRTMLAKDAESNLLQENIQADDVGALAAFLCSAQAKHITGSTLFVDSGAHIL